MTMLSVTIMILLSITVGVAWKHWELLNILRKGEEASGDKTIDDGLYHDNNTMVTNTVVIMGITNNETE